MRQEIIPAVNVTGPGKNYIVSVLAKDGPRAKSDVFFRIPGMLLGAAVPEEELAAQPASTLYTPPCVILPQISSLATCSSFPQPLARGLWKVVFPIINCTD